jgi:hypothetical protein
MIPIELIDFICEKISGKILVNICMNITNIKYSIFVENSLYILNKKRIERYWDEKSFHSDGMIELAYNNDLYGVKHILSYHKNEQKLPYNKFPNKIMMICCNFTLDYQFFNVYIIALVRGNLEMIKLLVKNGFDIKTIYNYNQSLCTACIQGDLNIVKYLVDYGLDISFKKYKPIIWASQYGHLEVTKYLIEKIGKLDDIILKNALKVANENNRFKVVEFLENIKNEIPS